MKSKKIRKSTNRFSNVYTGLIKDALDNFLGYDIFIENENSRNLNINLHEESRNWIFSDSNDYLSFNCLWEVVFPDWDIEKAKKYIMKKFNELYPKLKRKRDNKHGRKYKNKNNAK